MTDMRNYLNIVEGRVDSVSNYVNIDSTPSRKALRDKIEKELRAEGYTDQDIIDFEIEDRMGELKYEPFEDL